MSLTNFIQRPEVAAQLKPFRPPPPRKINAPLQVIPRTNHWSLVGTAFDYFLRFEIKRRAPHARHETWIIEREGCTVETLNMFSFHLPMLKEQVAACGWTDLEFTSSCDRIEWEARDMCRTFVKTPSPTSSQLKTLAGHAIRLARLEPIRRAGRIDETIFDDPDPADVEDLLAVLAVVPFEDLLHSTNLLLNPSPCRSPTSGAASPRRATPCRPTCSPRTRRRRSPRRRGQSWPSAKSMSTSCKPARVATAIPSPSA